MYLFDRSEHRKAKVSLACLLGGDTTNHVGTVRKGLLDMEGTLSRSLKINKLLAATAATKHTVFPVKPWQMTLVSFRIRRF